MEQQPLNPVPMDVDMSSETKDMATGDYSDVRLRLLNLSDADDFTEWLTDEKASEFCLHHCKSKEDAVKYVANILIPHPWQMAICLKDKPIGSITVTPFTDHHYRCRAEIGYVLGSRYWGRGIATKAVKMATFSVFRDWPHLQRLEAVVDVDNVGSQRVLEKVGFCREGVLRKYCLLKGGVPRDVVMYSIISTDPQVKYFMFN